MSGPPSPPPHPGVDSLPIKAGSSMDMFLNKTLSLRDRGVSEVFTVAQAMSILTTYIRHHRLYDLSSQMISSDIALENALQLRVLHASQLKEIVASFTLIGGQRPACRLRLALQNRSLQCAAADGKRYFLPTDLAYLLVREGLILVGNSRKSYSMEALRQLVARYTYLLVSVTFPFAHHFCVYFRYVVRKEHAVLDRRNPSVAQVVQLL